jgi:hypothetical protein
MEEEIKVHPIEILEQSLKSADRVALAEELQPANAEDGFWVTSATGFWGTSATGFWGTSATGFWGTSATGFWTP